MIVDDSFCRLTTRMIVDVRRESTIIDYHMRRLTRTLEQISKVQTKRHETFFHDLVKCIFFLVSLGGRPATWRALMV